jgi:hypothetical protein
MSQTGGWSPPPPAIEHGRVPNRKKLGDFVLFNLITNVFTKTLLVIIIKARY